MDPWSTDGTDFFFVVPYIARSTQVVFDKPETGAVLPSSCPFLSTLPPWPQVCATQ